MNEQVEEILAGLFGGSNLTRPDVDLLDAYAATKTFPGQRLGNYSSTLVYIWANDGEQHVHWQAASGVFLIDVDTPWKGFDPNRRYEGHVTDAAPAVPLIYELEAHPERLKLLADSALYELYLLAEPLKPSLAGTPRLHVRRDAFMFRLSAWVDFFARRP